MRIASSLCLLTALVTGPAQALNIFACEPEWASLAKELAPDANIFSATTAYQDPHRIEARPSLIAKARNADLVICTGAELEVGWLPLLLRQSGNRAIQPGNPGYFLAAEQVERLDIPERVDRSMGDVHASGNPHVNLDPRRLRIIAERFAERLTAVDPDDASGYRERFADFAGRWYAAVANWTERGKPLRDAVVVVHHKDWRYLGDWLGFGLAASLEPKPGIPPSAGHLAKLKAQFAETRPDVIIRKPADDDRASQWLARQTGAPAVMLPYSVGAEGADDLFALFNITLDRLLAAVGSE